MDIPINEDPKEVAKRPARLATEAIAFFDTHNLDDMGPSTSYDLPMAAGTPYLFNVVARLVRKC